MVKYSERGGAQPGSGNLALQQTCSCKEAAPQRGSTSTCDVRKDTKPGNLMSSMAIISLGQVKQWYRVIAHGTACQGGRQA